MSTPSVYLGDARELTAMELDEVSGGLLWHLLFHAAVHAIHHYADLGWVDQARALTRERFGDN
jgi:hypothetical protein